MAAQGSWLDADGGGSSGGGLGALTGLFHEAADGVDVVLVFID